jgi:hypothetical protein
MTHARPRAAQTGLGQAHNTVARTSAADRDFEASVLD